MSVQVLTDVSATVEPMLHVYEVRAEHPVRSIP